LPHPVHEKFNPSSYQGRVKGAMAVRILRRNGFLSNDRAWDRSVSRIATARRNMVVVVAMVQ